MAISPVNFMGDLLQAEILKAALTRGGDKSRMLVARRHPGLGQRFYFTSEFPKVPRNQYRRRGVGAQAEAEGKGAAHVDIAFHRWHAGPPFA